MVELEDLLKAYFLLVEVLNESSLFVSSKDLNLLVKEVNETRFPLEKIILYIYGLDWKHYEPLSFTEHKY